MTMMIYISSSSSSVPVIPQDTVRQQTSPSGCISVHPLHSSSSHFLTLHCGQIFSPYIQQYPFTVDRSSPPISSSTPSLWTDLLPLYLAVPLLLFPCQFQSKASRSIASFPFLTVCPMQSNFRLLIFMAPLFPLSFSKLLHFKSLPSNGCTEFFVSSG